MSKKRIIGYILLIIQGVALLGTLIGSGFGSIFHSFFSALGYFLPGIIGVVLIITSINQKKTLLRNLLFKYGIILEEVEFLALYANLSSCKSTPEFSNKLKPYIEKHAEVGIDKFKQNCLLHIEHFFANNKSDKVEIAHMAITKTIQEMPNEDIEQFIKWDKEHNFSGINATDYEFITLYLLIEFLIGWIEVSPDKKLIQFLQKIKKYAIKNGYIIKK